MQIQIEFEAMPKQITIRTCSLTGRIDVEKLCDAIQQAADIMWPQHNDDEKNMRRTALENAPEAPEWLKPEKCSADDPIEA